MLDLTHKELKQLAGTQAWRYPDGSEANGIELAYDVTKVGDERHLRSATNYIARQDVGSFFTSRVTDGTYERIK